eukprot:4951774-Pyramimonas_sp.AAC.1
MSSPSYMSNSPTIVPLTICRFGPPGPPLTAPRLKKSDPPADRFKVPGACRSNRNSKGSPVRRTT